MILRRPSVSWRAGRYCVLDFETTGVHLRTARPLSVGWVHVRDGRVHFDEAGYFLIRHEQGVPSEALGVHRLLPHQLRKGTTQVDAAEFLRQAISDHLAVAHFGRIELAMLTLLGIKHPRRKTIDTLRLAHRVQRRTDVTLASAAAREGIRIFEAHHAFGDALTTAWLFQALATRLEADGRGDIATLRRLGRVR